MAGPGDYLKQESRNRYLRSAHGGAVIGGVSTLPQTYFNTLAINKFDDWKEPFDSNYQELRQELDTKHMQEATEFQELVEEKLGDGPLGDGWYNESDIESHVHRLRNMGVRDRWRVEQFFAKEGGSGARESMGYGDLENGSTLRKIYDDEQFKSLLEGERPLADGETLEVHHLSSVKSTLSDSGPSGIHSVMDAENLAPLTGDRHLFEHGGDFRNPTTGDADSVTDEYNGIVRSNEELHSEGALQEADSFAPHAAVIVGVVGGAIGGLIRLRQLRMDPRPWKQKVGLVAVTMAQHGLVGMGVAVTASFAGHVAREFVAENGAVLASQLGEEASGMVLVELAGAGAAISAGALVRVVITSVRQLRSGGAWGQVGREAGSALLIIGIEQGAFFALGIIVDCITPIPEPTVATVVTVARIAWSVGKLGWKVHEGRKFAIAHREARFVTLFEMASVDLQQSPALLLQGDSRC